MRAWINYTHTRLAIIIHVARRKYAFMFGICITICSHAQDQSDVKIDLQKGKYSWQIKWKEILRLADRFNFSLIEMFIGIFATKKLSIRELSKTLAINDDRMKNH